MLSLAQVFFALEAEEEMVSFGDTYLHIPILQLHMKYYLHFVAGSTLYQFAFLPFRLTSVPWLFTNSQSSRWWLASCILLITHTCLNIRAHQWCLHLHWFQHRRDLTVTIVISRDIVVGMGWFLVEGHLSKDVSIYPAPASATVVKDASILAWSVHLEEVEMRPLWSAVEQLLHIILPVLQAIHLSLKTFFSSLCRPFCPDLDKQYDSGVIC